MTRAQFMWRKGKYNVASVVWCIWFTVYELILARPWSYAFAILFVCCAVGQVALLLRWRGSYAYWSGWAERWFQRHE